MRVGVGVRRRRRRRRGGEELKKESRDKINK
jgi:hypothetical protein